MTRRRGRCRRPDGAGLLLLADGYPDTLTPFSKQILEDALAKHLRLYVEYPGWLPDTDVGSPKPLRLERVVSTSTIFGNAFAPMSLAQVNGGHILDMKANDPLLVAAKVAGVDKAYLD